MIMFMTYEMTQIDDRIRVIVLKENKEVGSLYFEKAKKTFQRKPIGMDGWACVDAKIEDGNIFNEEFTPKDMVGECQDLIKRAGF